MCFNLECEVIWGGEYAIFEIDSGIGCTCSVTQCMVKYNEHQYRYPLRWVYTESYHQMDKADRLKPKAAKTKGAVIHAVLGALLLSEGLSEPPQLSVSSEPKYAIE